MVRTALRRLFAALSAGGFLHSQIEPIIRCSLPAFRCSARTFCLFRLIEFPVRGDQGICANLLRSLLCRGRISARSEGAKSAKAGAKIQNSLHCCDIREKRTANREARATAPNVALALDHATFSGDASRRKGGKERRIRELFEFIARSRTEWRTGRDSNPRDAINVYTLSRRAPSTTRPPVREGVASRGLEGF